MTVVGIRELKDKLSSYLRLVASGEKVLVTDRGRVVAELCQSGLGGTSQEPGVALLAREGLLAPGAPNAPDAYPALEPLLPAGTATRLLAEERGEG